jgi:hypothetical protein
MPCRAVRRRGTIDDRVTHRTTAVGFGGRPDLLITRRGLTQGLYGRKVADVGEARFEDSIFTGFAETAAIGNG